jgi:hypothetical protein
LKIFGSKSGSNASPLFADPHVFGMRKQAQIGEAIVKPIAVDVIDF